MNNVVDLKVLDKQFEQDRNPVVEEKSIQYPVSFNDFLAGRPNTGDIRALEAARLYKKCTPFFQSVNMRATGFSAIEPRVYDTSTEQFVDDHPVLELLKRPNPMQSQSEFMASVSSFDDIAGEAFIVATGDQGQEPMELFVARPQDMIDQESTDPSLYGAPRSWQWSTTSFTEVYRVDDSGRDFRYWNRDRDRELWQIKEFNPTENTGTRGLSKASPLWLQITQFIEADTNNTNVLKRGARPSLAWSSTLGERLTDDQFERIKQQLESYSGAMNAGKQVIMDDLQPHVISTSNKDMEFSLNRKTVREDIFSAYNIPLSLISADTMTMDNLKTGTIMLWDNAILPHAASLFDDLTRFLMPRYEGSENLIITYNPVDIPALVTRSIMETTELQKANILTDNELRTRIGYESLSEGGDTVFKPIGMAPVGSDAFTGDNLTTPDNGQKDLEARIERFRKSLTQIKDKNGERIYSDDEIEMQIEERFLTF